MSDLDDEEIKATRRLNGVDKKEDYLDKIVKCPWCKQPVRDGDRIWLDGDCLCPECYQHKRRKYYDKED